MHLTKKKRVSLLCADVHVLEFQQLGNTSGVNKMMLPAEDDDYSAPIVIPGGFPFWSSIQNLVYVRRHCKQSRISLTCTVVISISIVTVPYSEVLVYK